MALMSGSNLPNQLFFFQMNKTTQRMGPISPMFPSPFSLNFFTPFSLLPKYFALSLLPKKRCFVYTVPGYQSILWKDIHKNCKTGMNINQNTCIIGTFGPCLLRCRHEKLVWGPGVSPPRKFWILRLKQSLLLYIQTMWQIVIVAIDYESHWSRHEYRI